MLVRAKSGRNVRIKKSDTVYRNTSPQFAAKIKKARVCGPFSVLSSSSADRLKAERHGFVGDESGQGDKYYFFFIHVCDESLAHLSDARTVAFAGHMCPNPDIVTER